MKQQKGHARLVNLSSVSCKIEITSPHNDCVRGVLGCGKVRLGCKTPRFDLDFAPIRPVHAPYCPGFTSQTPRFASYVMERRGWDWRFSAKFGTGFARRGRFQRRGRRARRGRLRMAGLQAEGLKDRSLGRRPRWQGSLQGPEPCRGATRV